MVWFASIFGAKATILTTWHLQIEQLLNVKESEEMLTLLRNYLLPPEYEDEEESRRANLLHTILITILIFGIISTTITFLSNSLIPDGQEATGITDLITGGAIVATVLLLIYLVRKGKLILASVLLSITMLVIIAANALIFKGLQDPSINAFIFVIALASLLLGGRATIIFTLLSILTTLIIFLIQKNLVPLNRVPEEPTVIDWVIVATIFSLIGVLLYYAINSLNNALERARQGEQEAFDANLRLQELNNVLEQRVMERTRALATTIEVGRSLSTILDRDRLIREVVEQIRATFNYYHVQIYLYDEAKETLIMTGGTGEIARTLLRNRHKIAKGRGLVGKAAVSGSTVFVPDVLQAEDWLPNPLLAETKSEIAVPIAANNQILGVLDVQHNVPGVLTEQDADIILSISNQVGIALENARRYEEAQKQAAFEALVNHIKNQIQETDSIERALQVAARELGHATGAAKVVANLTETAVAGESTVTS